MVEIPTDLPEFLAVETSEPSPKEAPLDFSNLRLKPGQKIVLFDRRNFHMDEASQQEWEGTVREAFEKENQLDWGFDWVTLPAGDCTLFVAADEMPGEDGLVPAILIAIIEEKWTVQDFFDSIGDERFFGENNEIKRITDAEAKDGQAYLAYVEEGEVTDSATFQKTWEVVNQGVLDSLQRDYDVRTYQIRLDKRELYAKKLATFARRAKKEESVKRAQLAPKRGVSDEKQQKHLLSYVFRPKVVPDVQKRFSSPGEAFLALRELQFTPKGNVSKKGPNQFKGIPYCGDEGLNRANTIVWKSFNKEIESKEIESKAPAPETKPLEEKPAQKPPTLVYEDNKPSQVLDESWRQRSAEQELKILKPGETLNNDPPVVPFETEDQKKQKDIRAEIAKKITFDDVKDL